MRVLYYTRRAGAYRRLWLPGLLVSLGLMAAAVFFSLFPAIDLTISGFFYRPDGHPPWPASRQIVWWSLNRSAGFMTALLTVPPLVLIFRSFRQPLWGRYRLHMLYVILVLALGPGLLVNGVLKSWWGRPRPRETAELGGWMPYRTLAQPDRPGRGRSFPCGHASVGFAVVALSFVVRESRSLRRLTLAGTAVVGSAMSLSRIASGAHFFTDALFALGVVLFVAHGLYYFVLNMPARMAADHPDALCPGPWAMAAVFGLVALVGIGGAFASPYYARLHIPSRWRLDDGPIRLHIAMEQASVSLRFTATNRVMLTGQTEGYRGWFGKADTQWRETTGSPSVIVCACRPVGLVVDLKTEASFSVPRRGWGASPPRSARGTFAPVRPGIRWFQRRIDRCPG